MYILFFFYHYCVRFSYWK